MNNPTDSQGSNYKYSITGAEYAKGNSLLAIGPSQGSIITSDTPTYSIEQFPYPNVSQKQLKVFIHFAKLFVALYPEWTIVPNSSRPFESVTLENKKSMLRLIDKFPMNEIEIVGLSIKQYNELYKRAEFDPLPSHTIDYPRFQYWALGIEPLPDLLQ